MGISYVLCGFWGPVSCRHSRVLVGLDLLLWHLEKASCSGLHPGLRHHTHREQMPMNSQLALLSRRRRLTKAQLVDMSRYVSRLLKRPWAYLKYIVSHRVLRILSTVMRDTELSCSDDKSRVISMVLTQRYWKIISRWHSASGLTPSKTHLPKPGVDPG